MFKNTMNGKQNLSGSSDLPYKLKSVIYEFLTYRLDGLESYSARK